MSNYTLVTNFQAKDSLISGNPAKLIKGADFTTEFTAVQAAINSKVDGIVQFFPDGSVSQPSVGFTNNGGTGMYQSGGILNFATSASQRVSISAAGNVVVAAPGSGIALQLTGSGAIQALSVDSAAISIAAQFNSTNTNGVYISASNSGVPVAFLGSAKVLFGGLLTDAALAVNGANQLVLGTNSTGRVTLGASGNVSISAPSSGVAMLVNAAASGTAMRFTDSSTYGLNITHSAAGTGPQLNADSGNTLRLAVNGTEFVTVDGINVNVPNGAGSLSPIYSGVPQNVQGGASYTSVLADANKQVFMNTNGAKTFNFGVSIYSGNPAITIINGNTGAMTISNTGVTLTWATNNTAGPRTLATGGMATALMIGTNSWLISGAGLS